jgi:hypothetical protein
MLRRPQSQIWYGLGFLYYSFTFDLFLFRALISDNFLQFAQGVRAGPFLWTQGTLGALPDGTMVEGTVRITL